MRTIIFDLDGTLADTSADLIASANACFRAMGHGDVLDPQKDAATAFRGGMAMLRLGFQRIDPAHDPDAVAAQMPLLLESYAGAIDRHTRLYPGAQIAVETARAQGYRLGVCTNKPAGLAEVLLTRLGIRGLFDAVVGADTLPVRKPDAAPYLAAVERAGGRLAASYLVGDTETDRATARAAGVACALVTFGPDGRGVEKLRPEALLDHYDDLGMITTRLIG